MSHNAIRKQLRTVGLHPRHFLGQHFLFDKTVLQSIVDIYTQGKTTATVLEVGPGLGNLTRLLAKPAQRLLVVEKDTGLTKVLQQLQTRHQHIEVIMNDIFKVHLARLGLESGQYSVVANLPYNITSLFLRNFLTQPPWPRRMVLLVQKEVAQRIVAPPGHLSILALSVQLYCQPQLVAYVPRTAFYPIPEVDSAILDLSGIHDKRLLSPTQEKVFFSLIKAGFAQKRKLLLSNLTNIRPNKRQISRTTLLPVFEKLHISRLARAQELSLTNWRDLTIALFDNRG